MLVATGGVTERHYASCMPPRDLPYLGKFSSGQVRWSGVKGLKHKRKGGPMCSHSHLCKVIYHSDLVVIYTYFAQVLLTI